MTILIFTPTHEDGPHPDCLRSVSQQTYSDYVHEVSWLADPFPGRDFRNVVAQYRKAWQMALEGGYEALLTVEHDMLLPSDALGKLLATDAPVVYGLYMLRHGTKTLNAWRYENNRSPGMSLSLYPKEVQAARKQGWAKVSGVGWGCTLIRRSVLERISVRANAGDAGDVAFATDCLRSGIEMIARFDVECGHIEPDGNVLWPFQNGGGIVSRVLALRTMNALVDGQSMALKQGRYYSMSSEAAHELARAGYVRITNDPGEIETTEAPAAREMAVAPKQRRGKRAS